MIGAQAQGRPLRFLVIVMLCWTGGRIAATQDWTHLEAVAEVPQASAEILSPALARIGLAPADYGKATPQLRAAAPLAPRNPVTPNARGNHIVSNTKQYITEEGLSQTDPVARDTQPFSTAPLMPQATVSGRWSLSTWLFWRDAGGRTSLAGVGQLGGSQGGARLAYQLVPNMPERLALYARLASAFRSGRAPEAAVGLSVQPAADMPVRIAVERRVALDRDARDAFAVMAVGGVGPLPLPGGTVLEGYGQTGMVGLHRRDAFAEGKLTLLRPVDQGLPLSVGISLSGGAQPQVARLDIGPQIEAKVKLGDNPMRIAVEWRERIAGDARPASGLAITLASDF